MTESFIKINHWLYPLSWLYGIGVWLRNKLFDRGWLRSKSFDVPIICVGNLAVGGTGKTPHTEYLIKLLQGAGFSVATLSRGYKRKSRGYQLADAHSDARQIGDEPYQMKQKFPNVQVAVDADRRRGIGQLLKPGMPAIDVILLDDAFQHRYVKAGLNILLTDYHRLLCDDALLPAGRLREPASGKHRAQIVIVTKCPETIKPIDFNFIAKRLQLYPCQQLYFSGFRYGMLEPLFPGNGNSPKALASFCGDEQVLLVTGIASPTPLQREVEAHTPHVSLLAFADHHEFSAKDLQRMKERFMHIESPQRLIITTEKDAARLKHHPALDADLKPHIYVLPIEIEILQNQQPIFNQKIIDYVKSHSRNSSLPEREDAHPS